MIRHIANTCCCHCRLRLSNAANFQIPLRHLFEWTAARLPFPCLREIHLGII